MKIYYVPIIHTRPKTPQLQHLPFQPRPRVIDCLARTEKMHDIIYLSPSTLETVGIVSKTNPEEPFPYW